MRTFILIVIACAAIPLSGGTAGAQTTANTNTAIADLMSTREFENAGLHQLTPQQLCELDAWLDAYTRRIRTVVPDGRSGSSLTPGSEPFVSLVIESHIDGEFEGWEGDTIFTLQNGQVWQQVGPGAKYQPANSPRVVISGGTPTMKVQGVAGEVQVRRIR
jgi:hypothetical protein